MRRFLAKLYESLRVRRPVFALTNPVGGTARRLAETGVGSSVPVGDAEAVERKLPGRFRILREPRAPVRTMSEVVRYSRRARTGEVAAPLDGVSWWR